MYVAILARPAVDAATQERLREAMVSLGATTVDQPGIRRFYLSYSEIERDAVSVWRERFAATEPPLQECFVEATDAEDHRTGTDRAPPDHGGDHRDVAHRGTPR